MKPGKRCIASPGFPDPGAVFIWGNGAVSLSVKPDLSGEELRAFLGMFHYEREREGEVRKLWKSLSKELRPSLSCYRRDGKLLKERDIAEGRASGAPLFIYGGLTLGEAPGRRISGLCASGELGEAYLTEALCSFTLRRLYPLIPELLFERTGLWMRGMEFPGNEELQGLHECLDPSGGLHITPSGALLPECSVLFCSVLEESPQAFLPDPCEGCPRAEDCGQIHKIML